MQVQNLSHMFDFKFEKSSAEISEAASRKATEITAKIKEREARIEKLRKDYDISDRDLISILEQVRASKTAAAQTYNYNKSGSDGRITDEVVSIGAGVVNMLLTERDFIEGEKGHVEKLQVIVRNLRDLPDQHGVLRGHRLSFEEVRFLGF